MCVCVVGVLSCPVPSDWPFPQSLHLDWSVTHHANRSGGENEVYCDIKYA